jgi:hypothetical protein
VIGGVVGGLLLLAGYVFARELWRRRAAPVLPPGFFPAASVAVFGLGALVLAVITVTGSPIGKPTGHGAPLSGALVAFAVAAAYAPAARRALRSAR